MNDSSKDTPGPMLEVNDVSYAYDGAVAVANASLAVGAGEVVTVLGSNGAGKTTTAKIIAGALRPQTGTITFREEDLTGMPVHKVMRRGVILVPEGRLVFPEMGVEENLLMGAYKEKSKQRIKQLLDVSYSTFPRLKERRNQPAGSLSGGEQQMLAIGRGLMGDPKLLILDEPSLGVMPKLVREIFRLIREIALGGVSVLLIEQNVRASLQMSDRAYVLEKGRIILEGASRDLLDDSFIGKAYLGGG